MARQTTAAGNRLAKRAVDVVEAADRAFFAGAEPTELMHTLRSLATNAGGGTRTPTALTTRT